MNCIYCGHKKNSIVDSRGNNKSVKRTRLCEKCGKRFMTVELPLSEDVLESAATYAAENLDRTYCVKKALPPKKPSRYMKFPKNYYTVYNTRTDEIIAFGNAEECAAQLDVRMDSFFKMVMKSNRGESKWYTVITEKYEDLEDEL